MKIRFAVTVPDLGDDVVDVRGLVVAAALLARHAEGVEAFVGAGGDAVEAQELADEDMACIAAELEGARWAWAGGPS